MVHNLLDQFDEGGASDFVVRAYRIDSFERADENGDDEGFINELMG